MTTLAMAEAQLRDNRDAGRPLLAGTLATAAGELFSEIPGMQGFEVAGADLQITAAGALVKGRARLFGYDVDAEVAFGEADGALQVTLAASLPADGVLQVPAVPWVALNSASVRLVVREAEGGRQASGTVNGTMSLSSIDIPLVLEIPAADAAWRVAGSFQRAVLPSLAELGELLGDADLVGAVPAELARLSGPALTGLDIAFRPRQGIIDSLAAGVAWDESLDLVPGVAGITGARIDIAVTSASDPQNRAVRVRVGGSLSLAGAQMELTGEAGERLVLGGTLRQASLSGLLDSLAPGTTLPDEVPEVELSGVVLSGTPATGELAVSGAGEIRWRLGDVGALDSRIDFAFRRTAAPPAGGGAAASRTACTLGVTAAGPCRVADELLFESFQLAFAREESGSWSLSGGVGAQLFGRPFALAAGYAESAEGSRLLLRATTSGDDLVSIPGIGGLSLRAVEVEVEKARREGQPVQPSWRFAAQGGLRVENVLSFAGELSAYRRADGAAGMSFAPEQATLRVPLGPDGGPSMEVEFGGVTLARAAGLAGGWSFESSTRLSLRGLPRGVQEVFPPTIDAAFRADSTGVRITAERVVQPYDFEIPDVDLGDARVELGTARVDASRLAVILGRQPELSAMLGVGLPSELNRIFGVRDDGSPKMDFFNTFDPADPDATTVRVQLAVSPAGIRLVPQSSPLRAIRMEQKDGHSWWNCDFGDFGAGRLMVPELSYDAASSSFAAAGGFEITRPLALPLVPLQQLLRACKLDAAAEAIPDVLPLQEIRIADDRGEFRAHELVQMLEAATDGALPDEVGRVIEAIGNDLDKLPDRFKQYLNVSIPDGFNFSLAVAPDGSVRLDARVTNPEHPIRVLYPSFTPPMPVPMPVLNGIELRSISFGPMAGGSLFLFKLDADFDRFDLATLAGSLLLPDDDSLPLPSSRELHNRLVVDNLFMVIVYQTVIPIPIPLFYDRLGVEYLGIEGAPVSAHVSFPMPSPDMAEVARLLTGFRRFFTERDYLLRAEDRPEKLDLRFSLPDMYLQLPEYLGGASLGFREPGKSVSAYDSVAKLMNALKTLSFNDLVQAVPLEHRVGSARASLGPVSVGASWLVTTPDEFRRVAFRKLGVDAEQTGDLLAVLPAVAGQAPGAGGSDEQGLVVFLSGQARVAGAIEMDSVFGLAASDGLGFNTGFRFRGSVASLAQLEMGGTVAINAPATGGATRANAFQIAGDSTLTIAGNRVFDGSLRMTDRSFDLDGDLRLFPAGSPLQANGRLVGRVSDKDFLLSGQVKTSLAGVTLAGASARITPRQVLLQGTWLDVTSTLEVKQTPGGLTVSGRVAPKPISLDVKTGPISRSAAGRSFRVADGVRIVASASASLDATFSTVQKTQFSGGISASLSISSPVRVKKQLPTFTLTVAPPDVGALGKELQKRVMDDPLRYVDSLFKDASVWLKNIRGKVIAWDRAAYQDTGEVLRYVFGLGIGDAAKKLFKDAKYGAADTAKVLHAAFDQNLTAIAKALLAAGYKLADVTDALRRGLKASWVDVVKALREADQSMDKVIGVLRGAGMDVKTMLSTLADAGFDQAAAARMLMGGAIAGAGATVAKGAEGTAKKAQKGVESTAKKAEKGVKDTAKKIKKGIGKFLP